MDNITLKSICVFLTAITRYSPRVSFLRRHRQHGKHNINCKDILQSLVGAKQWIIYNYVVRINEEGYLRFQLKRKEIDLSDNFDLDI